MKFYWGRALNNQNQEFFFIDFVSCCTSFRPLLYGWSGCSRRGLSPSVRFFGPSESLGDFPQSSWWLFFRFWESWKSFFGVNKSPVLLFVTSRRFVSVRVSNGSLLKALLGFWKDKVFNLCVSCALCSRVLCALFFPFSWLKVASIWTREFASCVCFVLLQQKEAEEDGVDVWVWRVGVGLLEF